MQFFLGIIFALGLLLSNGDKTVVGSNEMILIRGESAEKTIRTKAKIDTGASSTSIDFTIADDLGIDYENAETITIISALGEEERPLVPIVVVIGDVQIETEATVTDRSALSTLALVGSDDLGSFLVDVSSVGLTTPDATLTDNAIVTEVSGPEGLVLLALMPLMAVLVLAFRELVGLKTVGLFTPVLLSIAFLQAETVAVAIIFVVMIFAGFLAEPLLRRLRLSRVSRLSVIMMAQIAVLFAAQNLLSSAALVSWALAVPVIVTLTVIESLWETWDSKGLKDALKTAVWTLILSAFAAIFLANDMLQGLASRFPLILLGIASIIAIALGRYRGLRATELWRFRRLRQQEAA